MEWKVDLGEINGLRQWYRNCPRKMQIACSRMLNNFAFGVKDQVPKTIAQLMIVRNPRFVSSRIRVTKTSSATPIPNQKSITGSVAIPSGTAGRGPFSGWKEQELGTRTDRKRVATLAARSGDKRKQMRPGVRLKPGVEVVTAEHYDYNPRGGSSNIGGMLAMMKRKGEQRIVKIGKVYLKLRRGKFEEVQIARKKQPKRIKWLKIARAQYFRNTNLNAMWAAVVTPLMGKPNKR